MEALKLLMQGRGAGGGRGGRAHDRCLPDVNKNLEGFNRGRFIKNVERFRAELKDVRDVLVV